MAASATKPGDRIEFLLEGHFMGVMLKSSDV